MGACYNRDAAADGTELEGTARRLQVTARPAGRGPSDKEAEDINNTLNWYVSSSPRPSEWVPDFKLQSGRRNRRQISEDVEDDQFDVDAWMEMAENGELDIYTCLGLSDANSFTRDTRQLMGKIVGVVLLQLMVPILMLRIYFMNGFEFAPRVAEPGFRFVGFTLYMYSLYSMYNNALDECRYRLLQFALEHGLSSGHWWPLALGELSNVVVSLVLVITLYFIYTASSNSLDLILNAVAVNFLGSVDAELVTNDTAKDAIKNFKELMDHCDKTNLEKSKIGKIVDRVLKTFLSIIVGSGIAFAFLFLLIPSPPVEEPEEKPHERVRRLSIAGRYLSRWLSDSAGRRS